MAMRSSRPMISQDIPEEVICDIIFSRMPFKLVTSLKIISRHCCSHLKNSTSFAAKQATLCPPCSALIHISRYPDENREDACGYSLSVLSSTPATVGVPSSRLDFLGCPTDQGHLLLLASSNGLLCIRYDYCYHKGRLTPPAIFIANPATQQAKLIPGAAQHLAWNRPVGLVFDPSYEPLSKQKFMIIQALPSAPSTNDTLTKLHFIIFSSDTGRWVMSGTTINTNIEQKRCDNVVYSGGVLYWDFQVDLLWFDVARSATGIIKMPWMNLQFSNSSGWKEHSIDASSNGMLMCTAMDNDGLSMHQLVKRGDHYYWELKHKKGWEDIMEMSGDALQFCHSMKLRHGWKPRFPGRWSVRPLGLESERWIYIGVTMTHRWNTSQMVLRYDMDTCKVEDTKGGLGNPYGMKCVFGYRNSMAVIPAIVVPRQDDGICDGKSGRCVCTRQGRK